MNRLSRQSKVKPKRKGISENPPRQLPSSVLYRVPDLRRLYLLRLPILSERPFVGWVKHYGPCGYSNEFERTNDSLPLGLPLVVKVS